MDEKQHNQKLAAIGGSNAPRHDKIIEMAYAPSKDPDQLERPTIVKGDAITQTVQSSLSQCTFVISDG